MSTSETPRKPPKGPTQTTKAATQTATQAAKKTATKTAAQASGLLPARLADAQLDHVERMLQFLSSAAAGSATHGIDPEYCRKRLQTLEQTHDLVVSQRLRIARLLQLLERASGAQANVLTSADADPAARLVAPRGVFAP